MRSIVRLRCTAEPGPMRFLFSASAAMFLAQTVREARQ
jgi:hypothetical protein